MTIQKRTIFDLVRTKSHASYEAKTLQEREMLASLENAKLYVSLFCARKAGFFILNAFFIIFLISVLAFTLFAYHCKAQFSRRLDGTFNLLMTLITYKFVLNNFIPNVSYLTKLDYYIITSMLFIVATCVWHTLVGRFWEAESAERADQWALLALAVAFATYQLFFLVRFALVHWRIYRIAQLEQLFIDKVNKMRKRQSVKRVASKFRDVAESNIVRVFRTRKVDQDRSGGVKQLFKECSRSRHTLIKLN